MNCAEFEKWLDSGMPAAIRPAAQMHAAGCARCAAWLGAECELDFMLALEPGAAPHGFTERVMARVREPRIAAAPAASAVAARWQTVQMFGTLAWWVRAAAEPACALAAGLAGLMLWRGHQLPEIALAVETRVARMLLHATPWAAGPAWTGMAAVMKNPGVQLEGLVMAATLATLTWAPLYRWAQRRVSV